MNRLINKAIDASIGFEELMDRIDFNSYLPKEQERDDVKQTKRYQIYKDGVRKALKSCQDVIDNIPTEIKDFTPPENPDMNKLTQYLIFHLFEAKKIRLEARKEITREKEEEKYKTEIHLLNVSFYKIPEKYFHGKQKNKELEESFNWAKVLYYNEFAICYSGLAESSMSLGYAEKAISILEKIQKEKIKYKNKRIFKLHTFALCNKGEAERNLRDHNKALGTFNKIIEKCEKNKKKSSKYSSDYYQALFRLALILIDQGRSVEAIEVLKKMKVSAKDTRYGERNLEKASALIDQKEYKEASRILEEYTENRWKDTFTQRKAKVYELRLLMEFKINRPEDFNKTKEEAEIETIKKNYKEFPQNAKNLLKECAGRYDGGNFKKTCTNLADYFHEENNREKALRCYYLYLCHELIFEKRDKLGKKSKDTNKIIEDWISQNHGLESLINKHESEDLVRFSEVLIEINDEPYLRGFFDTYYEVCMKNECEPNKQEKTIIGKLRERLVAVYREKDNLIELGEVEEKFSLLQNKIEPKEDKEKDQEREDVVKFVRDYFFRGKQIKRKIKSDKQKVYLRPDSITTKMEQNTDDFVHKIVGKTKLLRRDEKFRGRLIVLRRWNSFTPALASSVNPSKGGGYFLYFRYKNEPVGIVVDPGYDFLDNLFSQGFRIGDINAVIVSHAHPDHTDNLPSILSLFHELNGHLGEYHYTKKFNRKKFNRKHLKLIISQGVFDQYYKLIKPSEASLKDIFVVQTDNGRRSNIATYEHEFDDNYSLKIETFATSHKDLSQWESLGFIFKIIKNGKPIRQIGYTSDAHWKLNFSNKFEHCNIICAHLGSIVDILRNKDFCSLCGNYDKNGSGKCKIYDQCREKSFENGKPTHEKLLEQAQEQSHLYLSGLAMFFDELLPRGNEGNNEMKLAVISEFGEELKGGMRMDLYRKFDDWFRERSNEKARCVPGDIGLEIDLLSCNIYCCCCQEYKSKDRISPIAYGKEEAIFFVCDECKSVLSTYQIDEKLRDYYENGRKLELADESK